MALVAPAAAPPRRRVRSATVAATSRISPNVQRVTLVGDLHGFAAMAPGAHLKLFLPPEDGTPLVLPSPGAQGPIWPEGASRPVVRTNTPRSYDVVTRRLEVDVVQHGDGPAARWAASAAPGDRVALGGPGRGWEPDATAPAFLLAGDETALSALHGIAAALPAAATARVLVEVPTAGDAQDLRSAAAVDVRWLPRDGVPAGALLEAALAEIDLADERTRVWVAAEAGAVRRIREGLLTRIGLDREQVTVRGYWKSGEANHPDHDYGD